MDVIDAVELAARFVRTPSLSGDEAAMADAVELAMRELGYGSVGRDALGSVVGLVGPADGGPVTLLFDGHIDVVPPAGEWTVDPYGGEIRAGRIWGRGATDMKGGLAAMLCGVAEAADALERPVAVSATVLEETVEGVALASVLDRLSPEAVVICEPSGMGIRVGQRGRAEVLFRAHGTPAHAASPEQGRNPIAMMRAALERIDAMSLPADPDLGPAIIVATDIVSDPYPSISLIPSTVTVRFDRRTLPGEDPEVVLRELVREAGDGAHFSASITDDEVSSYTGVRLRPRRFLPAWRLDPEHPLARAAIAATVEAGIEADLGTWGFCTNGSESAGRRGIPTIGFGPGRPEDAHLADESVSADEVRLAADVYRRLATAWAGGGVGGRTR